MKALNPQRVETVYQSCLITDKLLDEGIEPVVVQGITNSFGFDKTALTSHRSDIVEMLMELPEEFHVSGGGGSSFLNACNNRNGELWTGLHQTMEHLVVLGIAIEVVEYIFPRDYWNKLPGGMPFFRFLDNKSSDKEAKSV